MSTAQPIAALHPYYPPGIRLSGERFVANDWDVVTLILAFAGGWALIAAATLGVVRKVNPGLKGSDQALVLWFVLCKFSFPENIEATF
jgi:cholestenol Delta-isomerase